MTKEPPFAGFNCTCEGLDVQELAVGLMEGGAFFPTPLHELVWAPHCLQCKLAIKDVRQDLHDVFPPPTDWLWTTFVEGFFQPFKRGVHDAEPNQSSPQVIMVQKMRQALESNNPLIPP